MNKLEAIKNSKLESPEAVKAFSDGWDAAVRYLKEQSFLNAEKYVEETFGEGADAVQRHNLKEAFKAGANFF